MKNFTKLLDLLYGDRNYNDSQNEKEFEGAWNYIRDFLIESEIKEPHFLEIGADRGLWSIAFFSVCLELGLKPRYTTVTLMDDDNSHYEGSGFAASNFLDYSNRNKNIYRIKTFYEIFDYEYNIIDGNSQDIRSKEEVMKFANQFDLTLIDGDHTYEGVMRDIELYSPVTKGLLIFHDILPRERCQHYIQVFPAIVSSGLTPLDREFIFDGNLMGIGIKRV